MLILVIIFGVLILTGILACCKVSGDCSRREEERGRKDG